MYFSAALVAATLAAGVSGFLIPPQISEAVTGTKDSLITILAGVPQTFELDCPGCPFAGIDEPGWTTGVENKIRLEFESSKASGLVINGQSILTSAFTAPAAAVISATQIRTSDGSPTEPRPLDFAFERLEPMTDPSNPQNMVVPVRFTMLAIGGQPIKVDTIVIDMIKTEEDFFVGKISTIPFKATPGAEACESASRWSLCRVKALIAFHMHQMFDAARHHASSWTRPKGGCPGRKHALAKPGKLGFWSKGKPAHHPHGEHKPHHHHHHHRHGRLHRLGRMVHQTLRFFVIPAMLGVIGGLMASAVGMLVGQGIVSLWQSLYRRNQPVEESAVLLVVDDEKTRRMEDESLPQYHEILPQYTDVESQPVDETKNKGRKRQLSLTITRSTWRASI